jgi:hypothetical protein
MMGTFFIQQGSLMDNSIPLPAWLGGGSSSGGCGSSGGSTGSSSDRVCLHIPAATMALFNTGAIILLVPLYDAFLEPAIKAAGIKWTLLRRIGEGGGAAGPAVWVCVWGHKAAGVYACGVDLSLYACGVDIEVVGLAAWHHLC